MNKQYLKKALVRGIPLGVILALAILLVRTLLTDTGFLQNLGSVYGILLLICIPVAWIFYFYNNYKNKGE